MFEESKFKLKLKMSIPSNVLIFSHTHKKQSNYNLHIKLLIYLSLALDMPTYQFYHNVCYLITGWVFRADEAFWKIINNTRAKEVFLPFHPSLG